MRVKTIETQAWIPGFHREIAWLRRHGTLAAVLVLALVSTAIADSAIPITPDLPKPQHPLCGRLTEVQGLPVLELWGSPEEAAYAHGFLLAEPIIQLFDKFVLDPKILPNSAMYEVMLIPSVRRQFVWTQEQEGELRAMLRGLEDRLPEDRRVSEMLDRPLQIEDLMIGNTLADWFGAMCSTFSVWGDLTPDGRTLTARNLDFPNTEEMARMQVVIVRRAWGDHPGWIGIGWPGTIGVYTAMSDRGVTMLMHDAGGLPPSENVGFTPRSLILREALSTARSQSWLEDVKAVFQTRKVLVGNNIHVSGPRNPGQAPAAVFEYDANQEGEGVTVRTAEANGDGLVDALWCTNHMRVRKPAVECRRFGIIEQGLQAARREGTKFTPEKAFELILEARQSITLHSVVLEPEIRVMRVSIPAESSKAVEFRLDEWLKHGENGGKSGTKPIQGKDRP